MYLSELTTTIVSNYMYENRDKVPIIDTVKINDFLYGRLDILLNRYYNGRMEYLPLLMDFNHITDPVDINIGRYIDIPDFDVLIQNLSECKIFTDENIPGVNSSMICQEVNKSQQSDKSKTKTTAIPKLSITLKKVSYDVDTGVITY